MNTHFDDFAEWLENMGFKPNELSVEQEYYMSNLFAIVVHLGVKMIKYRPSAEKGDITDEEIENLESNLKSNGKEEL